MNHHFPIDSYIRGILNHPRRPADDDAIDFRSLSDSKQQGLMEKSGIRTQTDLSGLPQRTADHRYARPNRRTIRQQRN